MILFLHSRYRTRGGEERVVEDLAWLVREHLGEEAEVLERDSAELGRVRAAAGLLGGGLSPEEVTAAVRRTGARIVHAHNLTPSLGPRALEAARAAGAARSAPAQLPPGLRGRDVRESRRRGLHGCHGRDTLPGASA